MGLFQCKLHGLGGIALVCNHIAQNVALKKNMSKVSSLIFNIEDFMGEGMEQSEVFYCQTCMEDRGSPSESIELSEDDFEQMAIGTTATCNRCFKEFMNSCIV